MSERTCSCCKSQISRSMLDRNYSICSNCGNYLRFHARKRIASLADNGTFREWDAGLLGKNPLNDPGYAKKLEETTQKHNLEDAIITEQMQRSHLGGLPYVEAVVLLPQQKLDKVFKGKVTTESLE